MINKINFLIVWLFITIINSSILYGEGADKSISNYFDVEYDINFYIYRPPKWLGENIDWNDENYSKHEFKDGNLHIHFLKNDGSDALVYSIVASEKKIEIEKTYENTASPERTHIELKFNKPRKISIETIGAKDQHGLETYKGIEYDGLLWSHVRLDEWNKKIITIEKPFFSRLMFPLLKFIKKEDGYPVNCEPELSLEISPDNVPVGSEVTADVNVTCGDQPVKDLTVYFRNSKRQGHFDSYPSIGRTNKAGKTSISFNPDSKGEIYLGAAATINKEHFGISKSFIVIGIPEFPDD